MFGAIGATVGGLFSTYQKKQQNNNDLIDDVWHLPTLKLKTLISREIHTVAVVFRNVSKMGAYRVVEPSAVYSTIF